MIYFYCPIAIIVFVSLLFWLEDAVHNGQYDPSSFWYKYKNTPERDGPLQKYIEEVLRNNRKY